MNNAEHSTKIKNLAELSRKTDRAHRKLFEKHAVEAFGIHRSQHMMLMFISHNENTSQRHIADSLDISAAAVAVTLKKLESAGLIVRNSSEADNRRNHISITDKGQKVISETRHVFGAIDRLMFEGFSDDEIEQLRCFSEKMYNNLLAAESISTEELKEEFDEDLV